MPASGWARTTSPPTTSSATRSCRLRRSSKVGPTSGTSAQPPDSDLALRRAELVVGEELHEQRVHVAFVCHVRLACRIEVVEAGTLPQQIRSHSWALYRDAIAIAIACRTRIVRIARQRVVVRGPEAVTEGAAPGAEHDRRLAFPARAVG